MTLAEYRLKDLPFEVMPATLNVYCQLCDCTIAKGDLAKRYSAATWTHNACYNYPLRTVAPHKYRDR